MLMVLITFEDIHFEARRKFRNYFANRSEERCETDRHRTDKFIVLGKCVLNNIIIIHTHSHRLNCERLVYNRYVLQD